MENMVEISKFKIIIISFLMLFTTAARCRTLTLYSIDNKIWKQSNRLYNRYLRKYGNASMIDPTGTLALVWYYENNKIHITKIMWKKKNIKYVYDCDSYYSPKDYEKDCYPEWSGRECFKSAYTDVENDSIYETEIWLNIDTLKQNGTDCPVLKELRDIVIKYKMWERTPVKVGVPEKP